MAKKISKATEEIIAESPIVSKKVNEEQMTALAHSCWKYRLQGFSYVEIGVMLGFSTAMVKNYIKSLNAEYQMEIWEDVDSFRQDLALKLFYIANETSKQWENAKSDFTVSPAHVAYLKNTRDAIKDLRDLMGLDAPKRTEVEVSTGAVPYTITVNLDGSTK